MAHFYQTLLQQSNERHAAAMAAISKPLESPNHSGGLNFAIRKPDDLAPPTAEASDLELARVAQAQGKHIELNDDNQIVDKRELLSAGLNLSGENTRDLATLRKSRTAAIKDQPAVIHTAVGAAASRREIEQRRQRELERQVVEEEERHVRAARQAEEEARERQVKRRNDDRAVQSALDRYRERKRRRLGSDRGDHGVLNE
jgi:coiled-coil domain-containing protein 55